ncbi:SDR family oxidoreductase [Mangrovicoccus sp. HB161399]|uniref:SDR family oxidoreductase n=1 Tax=Mangrovicoccus sp. HB161399 TaxID=2720392 RepID=UPI001554943F|nr:SDR family oxidoreductase [Mangrovicoccus sp. HB161399]
MNRLDGKIAVITGGTQGLGAATARIFAAAGAEGLVICGRGAEKGRKVAAEITEETGVPVAFAAADLGVTAEAQGVILEAKRVFGRVDVLVNAAGLTERGTLLDTSPELFDRMFAVNVRGPFFLMQEAARLMIRQGIEGSIVNIGSVSELAGQPFISPYVASKGALASLTRNSAFALMRNRIRVNQLDIGWMASDNEKALQAAERGDPDWLDKVAEGMPFGRLIDPVEVARAALFLASEDSGMMTGAVIPFDQSVWGGFAAAPPTPDGPMAL